MYSQFILSVGKENKVRMKQISGTMYAYSYLCNRKLWFYAKDIVMEDKHENVSIGKIIDEESYKRDRKHLYLDDMVCIDIVRDNVICEVKKVHHKNKWLFNN